MVKPHFQLIFTDQWSYFFFSISGLIIFLFLFSYYYILFFSISGLIIYRSAVVLLYFPAYFTDQLIFQLIFTDHFQLIFTAFRI